MSDGAIHVHGDAGRHVGGQMTGGRIEIDGNAGDWLGGEMHGGLIHVVGQCGRLDRRRLSRQQEGDDRRHHPDSRQRGKRGRYVDAARHSGRGGLMRRRRWVQHDRRQHPRLWIVWHSARCRHASRYDRDSSAPNQPSCCPPSGPPAASGPFFFDLIFRELDRLGFPVDQGLLDNELLPFSWRSGRSREG